MNKNLTGQYDDNKNEIHVGDLVILVIPRKKDRDKAVIFEVKQSEEGYLIVYSEKFSNNTMSVGSRNYKQRLNYQVYQVVGNVAEGVNESLFV